MRTAVVRIGVDAAGELSAVQLAAGMAALAVSAGAEGAEVVLADLAGLPASRREVEILMTTEDPAAAQDAAMRLCSKAFGTTPVRGVVTFVSRGTDDDAHGVLAGFGISGDIARWPGDEGWDIVEVTLRKHDLQRVPESRVHTALEASLNCEVRIVVL